MLSVLLKRTNKRRNPKIDKVNNTDDHSTVRAKGARVVLNHASVLLKSTNKYRDPKTDKVNNTDDQKQ